VAIIKSLSILLRGDTSRLRRDFSPAKKQLAVLKNQTSSIFKGVGFKIAGLAGAVVGFTSLAGAMLKVNSAFKAIDTLAKSADKIGATVGEMQSLGLAAKLSGTSMEAVERSMLKFSQTLGKAIGGDTTAIKALEKLGLTVNDFEGLSATQSFGLVSDAINKLGSQAEMTSATMEIFGRGGTEIFNLIKGGSAAVDSAAESINAFGGELSRVDAAKVELANDAWTKMQTMLDGVFQRIAVGVAPAFAALIETVMELSQSTGVMGSISTFVLDSMVTGIEIVSRSFSFMAGVVRSIQTVFVSVAAVILNGLAQIESALIAFGGSTFDFGIQAIADAADTAAGELAGMAMDNFSQAFGKNDFVEKFEQKMGEIQGRAEDIADKVEGSVFAKAISPDVTIDQKKLDAAVDLKSAGRGSQEAFATIFGQQKPMDSVVAATEKGNTILEQIRDGLVGTGGPRLAFGTGVEDVI